MSGWVDLKKVCISLFLSFSGFPYLLTTLLKDVGLSWPQQFVRISYIQRFSGCPYLLLHRKMSSWVDLKWFFLYLCWLISDKGFDSENDFRKGSPTRILANKFFFVSRLIDLKSGSGRRMQLLQVYRSGSTRSVFIQPCWQLHLLQRLCLCADTQYEIY